MSHHAHPPLLLTRARPVPLGTPAAPGVGAGVGSGLVDVLLDAGRVARVSPTGTMPADGARVLDLDGRWLAPGLWDHHVHLSQWVETVDRLDLSGARSAAEAVRVVAAAIGESPVLIGAGHRVGGWPDLPRVADLDAVTGERPVVLVSGDCHSAWLNSAALSFFGLAPRTDPLVEEDWFAIWPRLSELATADEGPALRRVLADAARRGVVGITDMDMGAFDVDWRARVDAGLDSLRIRAAVYPARLDAALARGLRTGDHLAGLVRMGPLKVITDGSLGTRTAHCHHPYPARAGGGDVVDHGTQNVGPEELRALLESAGAGGLEVALHAIGDAAVDIALDAVAATGARGGLEHVQLASEEQVARMAALDLSASVQPAHLLDDRDLTTITWPGREDRCFLFGSMQRAGVRLRFGSDAPVARLDPWLAMAAAVHRTGDDREPWLPEQSLTASEAFAASTDGWGTVAVGHPADVVALDDDPLAPGDVPETAARLREMRVALTVVDGRVVHEAD